MATCCASLLLYLLPLYALSNAIATSETLLLLPHLGMQLESRTLWCVLQCEHTSARGCAHWNDARGGVRRRFLPLERVAAVLLNEAVSTTDVRFYLALVLRDEPRLALPFPQLAPRLAQLTAPYRAAAALLPPDAAAWPTRTVVRSLADQAIC